MATTTAQQPPRLDPDDYPNTLRNLVDKVNETATAARAVQHLLPGSTGECLQLLAQQLSEWQELGVSSLLMKWSCHDLFAKVLGR